MKSLKKLIKSVAKIVCIAGMSVALILPANAAISTVTLTTANNYTNVSTILGGSFVLLSATTTSPANNTSAVTIYDAPGTNITFVVSNYSTILSLVTNYISTWTNYYGVTNSITNRSLVDYSNNVAQITNLYPVMYTFNNPTNSTVQFNGLNTRFQQGAYITNVGNTTVTITLQYTQ